VFGKNYGIIGILSVMLFGNLVVEFSYFTHRLYRLGYLDPQFIKSTLFNWVVGIPIITAICWLACYGINSVVEPNMYILKIAIISGTIFIVFATIILIIDKPFRNDIIENCKKLIRSIRLKKNHSDKIVQVSIPITLTNNHLIKQ